MTHFDKNKKRFRDDQIKCLETIFRADSRPESKTKQQLAGELGLQPRQVAIWFQNRRARSRTKHIENEYTMLKASHDKLVSAVESLKRENHELNTQLHELKNMLGKKRFELDRIENAVEKESEVLDLAQSGGDGSLTSSVDWTGFDSTSCYVDESSCPQWWEFWS